MQLTSRRTQALAASIAALVVAAPIAFQNFHREVQGSFTKVQSELKNAAGGYGGSASAPSPQIAAETRRERDSAPKAESKIALEEAPVASPSTAQPSTDASSPEVPALSAEKRSVPPDLVGKSQIGADGPDPRYAAGVAGTRPDDGLGAVGGALSRQPWDVQPNSGPESAPPPAATREMAAPSEGRSEHSAPKLQYAPARTSNGPGKLGGPAPAASMAQAPAAADATTNAYIRDLGSPADGDRQLAGKAHEAAKRKVEAVAAAPGQPVKPDLNWMGRSDDERTPVVAQEQNRDKFDAKEINPVKQVASEPVSTFSIDVDTASYAIARRALNSGHLPPRDSVRVEEMINYFPYAYPAPDSAEEPFKPTVTVMPSPWNARNQLVHVAIKGYDLKSAERPHANIVLLMDVSGSMEPADRLPLVKNAFRMLVDQLKPDDSVSIVTYASGSGIALEPTKVENKGKILRAIDELGAGGSTAGAAGIADAYRLAEENFDKNGVNRIILATDGDFNVGVTDQSELKSMIERKRQSGIFLSILGVGQGNHNDALMQTLAQNGNGTAAYADTLSEARKVLVEESSSTLFTIAKDVKAQIEWNPARVAEYRLIGYETRGLKREDFNNDRVDAGDIGSGHTVTAIYEVTPVGAPRSTDELRYAKPADAEKREATPAASNSNELGFLKLRFKRPNEDTSQLITLPIEQGVVPPDTAMSKVASQEARFSVAVAAFGQMLKGETYTQGYSYDDVLKLAGDARGEDPFGYRAEFLNLVRLAKSAQQ